MDWILTWLDEHKQLLFWLFVLSLASLALTAMLLPGILARLPADYFAEHRSPARTERGLSAWLLRLSKNLLGVIFVLAGIAMLVLPGQGLLTILIGLLLLDIPGKRRIERKLIGRPAILRFVNRLRQTRGHAPLQLDSEPPQDS